MKFINNFLTNKFIGDLEPTMEHTINGIECYVNTSSTFEIIKALSLEDVKSILQDEFNEVHEWMPDPLILKRFYKEYPSLPLLKKEMNKKKKQLPYPIMFWYGEGKSLVTQIETDFYIFKPRSSIKKKEIN